LFGRLDASDQDVIPVAQALGAHDFIMGLKNGYETAVGESGATLSVGQRQLISFARALVADPRILILDEGTSSVDTQTEQIIQKALATLLKGRTSFVIAHRLSTITNADKIVVIHDGKIIEQGKHAELLVNQGMYYELYKTGFQEEMGILIHPFHDCPRCVVSVENDLSPLALSHRSSPESELYHCQLTGMDEVELFIQY